MALVFVSITGDGPSARKLEITLGSFQCLDMGFLVDRQYHGSLRRTEIQTNDVGRLSGKFGISTQTPRMTTLKLDTMLAHYSPHLMRRYVAQGAAS